MLLKLGKNDHKQEYHVFNIKRHNSTKKNYNI